MPGPTTIPSVLVEPRALENFIAPTSTKLLSGRLDEGVFNEQVRDVSPWQEVIGIDDSMSQFVGQYPAEHRSSVASRWLGYAYVDGTHLRRVMPVTHPYYEFMRCRRIGPTRGLKHRGKSPKAPVDLGPAYVRPKYAEYDVLESVFHFETLPFKIKTDGETTEEWERWVYHRVEPSMENLYVEGGSADGCFLFDVANDDTTGPGGSTPKQSFPGGRNIILPQARVLLTWFDVPESFVQGSTGIYDNILDGIGKVNDEEFYGYPAYTLLADVPRIDIRPNPLPPEISTDLQFLLNITLVFNYFEPTPLGNKSAANGGGSVDQLGHNMAQYRGDRKWYPVSRNGAATAADRLYQEYDYNKFFRKPTI